METLSDLNVLLIYLLTDCSRLWGSERYICSHAFHFNICHTRVMNNKLNKKRITFDHPHHCRTANHLKICHMFTYSHCYNSLEFFWGKNKIKSQFFFFLHIFLYFFTILHYIAYLFHVYLFILILGH